MNKSISFNNTEVYYRVIGNGQPIIFIHGFGEDGTIWDNQVLILKDKFQLIIPDLPGSGKSPTSKYDLSMELMADCIYQVILTEIPGIAAIKESKQPVLPVLIGHSMGGYITLAFAEKFPRLVKAFGLFHSTAYADSDAKKEIRRKSILFIQQHGAASFIEQSIPNLFSKEFAQKNPSLVRELVQRYTNFSEAALVQYYEAMIKRPDRTHLLEEFRGPVLFIMGAQDTAIPLEHSLQQCHLPTICYMKLLEGSGHMGMLEESEKTNYFLEKFLSEIDIVKPVPAL